MGYINQSFLGVKTRWDKGEVKKGKGVREGTGPEGERGGKNEGKGCKERGPKERLKNSDFGTPMILVLLSDLSIKASLIKEDPSQQGGDNLSGPVLRNTARLSQRYPLLRAMGFLVSQHGQLGAISPSPFLSVSPLESVRSGGTNPPPLKRGISAILARYPLKTRQSACDTPLCDTISKALRGQFREEKTT